MKLYKLENEYKQLVFVYQFTVESFNTCTTKRILLKS